jgi:hypothetical protein
VPRQGRSPVAGRFSLSRAADLLVHQDENVFALLLQQGFVDHPLAAASSLRLQQEFPELSHGYHLLSNWLARKPGAAINPFCQCNWDGN